MITATELVEGLLQGEEPVTGIKPTESQICLPTGIKSMAEQVVAILLDEAPVRLAEASLHRSKGSRIWQAAFTGPRGGQIWRSTGLTNREQALLLARKWEAEAREARGKLGGTAKKAICRVRRSASGARVGLSQKEIALLLNMTERGVREVERRAIQKLRSDPLLRHIWREYLAGQLDEQQLTLTSDEIGALFNLARTPEERHVIRKVLRLIHGRRRQ